MSQELDPNKSMEQLNEEADIAADYLEDLLDIVDYDGDIEMGVRNHRPTVQIVADDDSDIQHLIGQGGEVVDALQRLTRLAVQQRTGERSHLIIDVDGFLHEKRQKLRQTALTAIDEVQESGEPVDLRPMNSFERKIVHDLVREEGLKSRSHGEEPHRYVTIYAKVTGAADAGDEADADADAEDVGGTQQAEGADVELLADELVAGEDVSQEVGGGTQFADGMPEDER
ncbi:hypothetical protein KIM372_17930 [Bombiscardovia nodaiensis]|uniref:R3H domain-containing protein n=1 Tax=Bombiscardovia nodaiensis TaxID=2932181 RepID=A0ABN6SG48_9BIFI|nr:hypothetical protein KIM372_17930 [Bombiscardovia nodaiensis]